MTTNGLQGGQGREPDELTGAALCCAIAFGGILAAIVAALYFGS